MHRDTSGAVTTSVVDLWRQKIFGSLDLSDTDLDDKIIIMDLSAYRDLQEGLTVLAFDKEKQEVVESLRSRVARAKDIADPVRRKTVTNNLQQFLKEMETAPQKLHGVWVVVEAKVAYFPVSRHFVQKWGLKDYALFQEVPRLYLEDVFVNSNVVHAVKADKNNRFVRYEGTRYKSREVGPVTLAEFSRLDVSFVLYGKNIPQKLELPKTAVATVAKDLSWPEVIDLFQRQERLEVHRRLQNVLDKMSHPRDSHLLLYSKDISTALEQYTIKELFVMRSRFQQTENTAVTVHLVDFVEPGDVTEKFERDLEGVIGVKYFI